jgi:hypothetical protein
LVIPQQYQNDGMPADQEPPGEEQSAAELTALRDQCTRTVLFHPCCHIDVHEGLGYQRLHQLTGRPAGDRNRLLSVADLAAVAERPAAG